MGCWVLAFVKCEVNLCCILATSCSTVRSPCIAPKRTIGNSTNGLEHVPVRRSSNFCDPILSPLDLCRGCKFFSFHCSKNARDARHCAKFVKDFVKKTCLTFCSQTFFDFRELKIFRGIYFFGRSFWLLRFLINS